jgi:hypothetical protein
MSSGVLDKTLKCGNIERNAHQVSRPVGLVGSPLAEFPVGGQNM